MNNRFFSLVETLVGNHSLCVEGYEELIGYCSEETASYLASEATTVRQRIYGNSIYIRGLIEISNICKNDCFYCGIRRSNKKCERYRLTPEQIFQCCEEGYKLGFRTFVLQGAEDAFFTEKILCDIIGSIKENYPDCAITLSLGERSRESYQMLYNAGADRYLLRHETADSEHYGRLHPPEMYFNNRMRCLQDLRDIGFQTGCGFMVGSPYQTNSNIAKDLKFIENFKPDMCGIGPFIPQKDTLFYEKKAGTALLTCYLLSIIRLIHPPILLPSTTALGTIEQGGREKGILAGANVVMPNLSPLSERKKYLLYDNKICTEEESAQSVSNLAKRIQSIGFNIVTDRGDIKI